jgi:hypothetical protein
MRGIGSSHFKREERIHRATQPASERERERISKEEKFTERHISERERVGVVYIYRRKRW